MHAGRCSRLQSALRLRRGVAQPGRALGLGPRSRGVKSLRPDSSLQNFNPSPQLVNPTSAELAEQEGLGRAGARVVRGAVFAYEPAVEFGALGRVEGRAERHPAAFDEGAYD